MKQIACAVLAILFFFACKKDKPTTDSLTLQENGKPINFYNRISARWVSADKNFISITAYDTVNNRSFIMAAFKYVAGAPSPLSKGNYFENDPIVTAQANYAVGSKSYTYFSSNFVLPPHPTNPFIIFIKNLSDTRIEGSFSGTFRNVKDNNPNATGDTLRINGAFNLPINMP